MKFNILMMGIGVSMLVACNGKSKQNEKPNSEKENTPPVEVLEFEKIPVPANAGENMKWELQKEVSDDFNYVHKPANQKTDFGNGKWYNFYHNAWNGPGTTYWQYDHVAVDGNDLIIKSSRNTSTEKMGVPGVNAGCITGNKRVKFPVFVEASVSVSNIALASDVWLLSPDDTQEIDIIECYGGKEPNNSYFSKFIHLSHHSFIREPFTDYQPRDLKTWWKRNGVTSWGEYSWNNGNRKYVRVAVNWINPSHFEYYIDGELVRVLYKNAMANKINGQWEYDYSTMTNGKLDMDGGYQKLTNYKSEPAYSLATLKQTSEVSKVNIIDPYNFQKGTDFNKEMDIIINVESQNWHVLDKRTPSDEDLADPSKNTMKVDWIRVYKPIKS